VRCPAWCVTDHEAQFLAGLVPPNGDVVLHASAPLVEMSEPETSTDGLRVRLIQRQVHPDYDGEDEVEILVEGAVTLSHPPDGLALISALQAATLLLTS
jgi:hypothetical protein